MKKLRIGVVGLGGIAQKAWLPVLAAASDGRYREPGRLRAKALPICESWRIPYADSLSSLAASCDAVFSVHSSTASHFDVVSTLLNAGVHVCVDKPLAENLRDADAVELAARKKLTLMVGFNRRFAPLYGELKTQLATAASLRMDKHRAIASGHTIFISRCWMIICMWWIPRCGCRVAKPLWMAVRY
ncbi:Gfo/Idh/MocA family protein [Escherichia coli]